MQKNYPGKYNAAQLPLTAFQNLQEGCQMPSNSKPRQPGESNVERPLCLDSTHSKFPEADIPAS
ncbi:hypothetical protein [Ferrovum myxofaciens]|uniref:hypothetical protein n=1 Tax=Ferrovum myxofaciens TaxID=416213 RepID=UPI0023575FBE|nr:hypothetical protein [Ferrovum myxofaciens]